MTSWLRAARGGGSAFSRMIRAGRSDRKNSRSASWTASVEIMGHEQRRHLCSRRQRQRVRRAAVRRRASSSDTKGSSSRRKSGRDRKCAGDRRAARQSQRQFAGISRQMRAEAECLEQIGRDRRRPRRRAAQAGYFARPCARAAGEAPEIRSRDARILGCGAGRGNPDPARPRSCRIVVLPQPEGPISAPNDPASSRSSRPRTTSTGVPSADRKLFASMRSSSGAASPAVCASFKRLHQKAFDHKHKHDEADRIAQYPGHVEQRESRAQDEPDAVRDVRSIRPPARSSRRSRDRNANWPPDRARAAVSRRDESSKAR